MSGGSYVKLLLLLVIHFGNSSTIERKIHFPANITNDVNNNSTDIKQTGDSKILVYSSPGNTTSNNLPFNKRSKLQHKIKSIFITTFVFGPHQRKLSASDINASKQPVEVEKRGGILKKIKDTIIKSSQEPWETIGNAFKPIRKVIIIRNVLPCRKSLTIDTHVCNENCTYHKLHNSRAINGNYSIMDALVTRKEEVNNATTTLSEQAKTNTTLNQLEPHKASEKNIAILKINFPYLDRFWKSLESINDESFKSKSTDTFLRIDNFLSNNNNNNDNNTEMNLPLASKQTNSRKKRNSNVREFETTENRAHSSPENNTVSEMSRVDSSSNKPNSASNFATNESELKKATFLNELMDLMALDGYVPVVTDKNVPYIQLDTKISGYFAKEQDYGRRINNTPIFLIVTIPSLIAIVTFVLMIYYVTKDNGLCCRIFQLRSTSSETSGVTATTKKNHTPTADLPQN